MAKTEWNDTAIYTVGMEVTSAGVTYIANWWSQGVDPADNNGGAAEPWTIVATSTKPTGQAASRPAEVGDRRRVR